MNKGKMCLQFTQGNIYVVFISQFRFEFLVNFLSLSLPLVYMFTAMPPILLLNSIRSKERNGYWFPIHITFPFISHQQPPKWRIYAYTQEKKNKNVYFHMYKNWMWGAILPYSWHCYDKDLLNITKFQPFPPSLVLSLFLHQLSQITLFVSLTFSSVISMIKKNNEKEKIMIFGEIGSAIWICNGKLNLEFRYLIFIKYFIFYEGKDSKMQ